jgi:FlaA1/EpsC-like NDP-sugar epimerase
MFVVVDGLLLPNHAIPRSIVLLDWGTTIVAVGGLRALVRLLRDEGTLRLFPARCEPALIVGANDSGEALLRAIHRPARKGHQPAYRIVGLLDADPRAVGNRIAGVPVVGTLDQMGDLARKLRVREVLIAAGELSGTRVRHLVETGRRQAIRVRVLPSYQQLLDERVAVQPRALAIEDLLRREPIRLDMKRICRWIERRVVLVTGSAGSIGSEICRQILPLGPARLVLVDRAETGQFFLERELRELAPDQEIIPCLGDVCDILRMEHIFQAYRPEIVFHAAAYKHVPLMQTNAGEAVKNIALATRLLADMSHQHHVRSFVFISTDKAVNPASVMGSCKRIAEQYVQSLAAHSPCQFTTVRFGNVLDSQGSVVPIFRNQIARGGPVTITHPDMTRYFMTISEASQLVIQSGAMGKGGEIFILDMGEPVRIMDLATDMIRLSGLRCGEDIEIKITGPRPGEKLHEELHALSEGYLPTSHPKIHAVVSSQYDFHQVLDAMQQLDRVASGPDPAVIAALQRLVPHLPNQPSHRDDGPRVAA